MRKRTKTSRRRIPLALRLTSATLGGVMRLAGTIIVSSLLVAAAASAGPGSVIGPYATTSRSGKRQYVKGHHTRKQTSVFPQQRAAEDPIERRLRMKEKHLPM